MIDYNSETLRLRNSLLLTSSLLLVLHFLIPTDARQLTLVWPFKVDLSRDTIVFLFFVVAVYKFIYYLFRLRSDDYLNKRLAHAYRKHAKSGLTDLALTNDLDYDRFGFNALIEATKALKVRIEQIEKDKLDSSSIADVVNHDLKAIQQRAEEISDFYRNEELSTKVNHYFFMLALPVVIFIISVYLSKTIIADALVSILA